MNHCRDKHNKPICLECAGQVAGELTNAVNASNRAIKCANCGGEIPSIMKPEITPLTTREKQSVGTESKP